MRTLLILPAMCLLLSSCGQGTQTGRTADNDTLAAPSDATPIVKDIDTTGLSTAPVKLLSYELYGDSMVDTFDNEEDNLNHDGHFRRTVKLRFKYKNVSTKRITAIRFRWTLLDAQGNISDLRPTGCDDCAVGSNIGEFGEFSDNKELSAAGLSPGDLKIGQTRTDEWWQHSETAKKFKFAVPVEVEFYDKTRWKLGK